MPEPVTTSVLVASALSAGAGALGSAVVKDAYEKLRTVALRTLGPAVEQLEAKPDSDARAAVVAELVDEQPEPARAELHALAEQLDAALRSAGQGPTVDNRITVIATNHSIAAGRDAIVGQMPKPGG